MNYQPYAKIAELFPIQPAPPEPSMVLWSRLGKFPSFIRPVNRKSPPLWDMDAVKKWIEAKYSPFFETKNKRNGKAK